MTSARYQVIQQLARDYLLAGGSIVPSDSCEEMDITERIAVADFKAAAIRKRFDTTLASLSPDHREQIDTVACELRAAMMDAAFVFGCAVGSAIPPARDPPEAKSKKRARS